MTMSMSIVSRKSRASVGACSAGIRPAFRNWLRWTDSDQASEVADFKMDMYNADGTQSEMCGNGIRCVGKYVYDYGLTDKTSVSIETLAGIKYLEFTFGDEEKNGRKTVELVRVNMGAPILAPEDVPVDLPDAGDIVQDYPIMVAGKEYRITCVSMGNPHCVSFVDDVDNFPLEEVGPLFENNPIFPRRVNAEFVELVSPTYAKMRVWELEPARHLPVEPEPVQWQWHVFSEDIQKTK